MRNSFHSLSTLASRWGLLGLLITLLLSLAASCGGAATETAAPLAASDRPIFITFYAEN